MKRVTIGFGAVLVLLFASLFVAPSFIDWTNYRDTFEAQFAQATGRTVAIEGDVSLALLPRPAFQVESVRIANPVGATDEDFAFAERIAVNLAFGPLLTGRLQFTSIEIISPAINAETLEDGSVTWALSPGDAASAQNESDVENAAAFDLGIDNLTLTDGTVRFRDARSGSEQEVSGVTLDLAAKSTAGPFDASGRVTALGLSWTIDGSLGEIRDGRPSALVISVLSPDTGLSTEFSGALSLESTGPELSGRVSSFGNNLANVLIGFGAIAEDQAVPNEVMQDFRLEARVESQSTSVTIDSVDLRIGATTASGSGLYEWSEEQRFSLSLSAARLDLEAWQLSAIDQQTRFADMSFSPGLSSAFAQTQGSAFALPTGLNGTFDAVITLAEWRGQLMRNVRVSTVLQDSELTVVEAGLDLPGNSAVKFSGFLTAENGLPAFDLTGEASSRDVRTLLEWLDAAPPDGLVSPSRLNSMAVATRIKGSSDRLTFDPLNVTLDTMELDGTAIVEPGEIFKTALDLSVSNFDLDSYLPAIRDRLANGTFTPVSDTEGKAGEGLNDTPQEPSFLSAADAQLKLQVGALTVGGNVLRGISLDVAAKQGALVFQNSSIDDFAGAQFSVAGKIANAFVQPQADNVTVQLSTSDFSRLNRTLGLEMPRIDVFAGPLSAEATVGGLLDDATIEAEVDANGLRIGLSGAVQNVAVAPQFALTASIKHAEYATMMQALGVPLTSTAGSIGAVDVRALVTGSGQNIQVQDLTAQAGSNSFSGSLVYDATLVQPRMSGAIHVESGDIDQLLPSDPTEQFARTSRGRSSRSGTNVSARWTTEPLDLTVLSSFDADVAVTATQVRARGVDIGQLTANVSLSSGVLTIPAWSGTLYGGPATGDLTLVAGPPVQIQTTVRVSDAALDSIGGALAGTSQASGKASLQGSFSASGVSQRDLVSSLAGNGQIVATGIDANSSGQGFAFTAVLAPVRALSQLGGVFSGGVTQGLASMGAEFSGEQGVFTLSNASLQSNVYSGAFSGTVDLPRWWIDAEGKIRLEVNLITQLLGNRLQMPSLIPITVSGPLDLPNVNMDTSGGAAAAQPEGEVAPAQMAPSEPSQPNPVDLFQGILNELAKPR